MSHNPTISHLTIRTVQPTPADTCFRCGKPLEPHLNRPIAMSNPDGTSTLISGLVRDTQPNGTLAPVHLSCYQASHGSLPTY